MLVPLTVVATSVGLVSRDRGAQAAAAVEVVDGVEEIRALVGLQLALYGERASVEIVVRSSEFGVPVSLAGGLLGVGLPQDLYAATEEALAGVESAPFELDLLREARLEVVSLDAGAIALYEALDSRVVDALVGRIESMSGLAVGAGDPELARSLEHLETAVRSLSSGARQVTSLAGVWFGPPETQSVLRAQLGIASAEFELAAASLDASLLGGVLGGSVLGGDDAFSRAILEGLSGELEPNDDEDGVAKAISVFAASFDRNSTLAVVVEEAADRVELQAAVIAADAQTAYRMALALGSLAVLVSMTLSWLLARSIARPLQAIAATTTAIRDGQIDVEVLAVGGPNELMSVANAVNDVVGNLRLLEGKLAALSSADLNHDVLSAVLPGRLGETLDLSVGTLSRSIADREELQDRLSHQATHDALTELANRARVLDYLELLLEKPADTLVGLLFIDLDDFKRINDTFGHSAGDRLLVQAADRLQGAVRPGDLVARLGGDEFLVVVDGCETLDMLLGLASRIRTALIEPIHLVDYGSSVVGASIGVAMAGRGTISGLDMLARADAALYRAKAHDDHVVAFDDALMADVVEASRIERELGQAIAAGDLNVHYQPLVDSATGSVMKVEALVRWPANGGFGPDLFIPIAERSDLIVDLDRFVLLRAATDVVAWDSDPSVAGLTVSVNLSGRHLLRPDVVEHVAEALTESGLAPQRLIVEVTETALITDQTRAANHLEQIRSLGVRVAVDDFGTGFTSISQLRHLPIDEIKIDRSLVMQLPDSADRDLVRVVQELADHFGLITVAEGVETEPQARYLTELGCQELQGWLYAKAMDPEGLSNWMQNRLADTVGAVELSAAPDRNGSS